MVEVSAYIGSALFGFSIGGFIATWYWSREMTKLIDTFYAEHKALIRKFYSEMQVQANKLYAEIDAYCKKGGTHE